MSEIIRTVKRLADSSADVLGVIGGISALRGNLRKVTGTAKKEGAAEDQKTSTETQVRMSGLFDLSDEIAFAKVEAQLQSDPECEDKGYSLIISRFLNTLEHDFQRRKFRSVVGELSNLEYSKEVRREKDEIPRQKGKPIVKERVVEIKTNIGIEFLKSLCKLKDDAERKEVCEALGVLDSLSEKAQAELEKATGSIKKMREASKQKTTRYKGFFKTATSFRRGK